MTVPSAIPASGEEERLLASILDKAKRSARTGQAAATRFLTERERILAEALLKREGYSADSYGGCPSAERRLLYFRADWQEEAPAEGSEESPVSVLRARYRPQAALSHRDFLGALMGLGITRDTVGDIWVKEGVCDFAVLRELVPFLLEELKSAGREALTLTEIPLAEPGEIAYKEIRDTVSSLRLDAVVGAAFSLSREKATQLIQSGRVAVDGLECLKSDRKLTEGCRLTVHGLGKAELTTVGGLSKKGRTVITCRRFL